MFIKTIITKNYYRHESQKGIGEVNCAMSACPWGGTWIDNFNILLTEQSGCKWLEAIYCNILVVNRIMGEFHLLSSCLAPFLYYLKIEGVTFEIRKNIIIKTKKVSSKLDSTKRTRKRSCLRK